MQSEGREEEGNYTWCPSGFMTFFVLKVFIKCLTLIVYPTLTIFVLSLLLRGDTKFVFVSSYAFFGEKKICLVYERLAKKRVITST